MESLSASLPHDPLDTAEAVAPATSQDTESQLRRFPAFTRLSDEIISLWAARAETRNVPAGETVFAAGQYEADDIYCFVRGNAQVTQADAAIGSIMRRQIGEGEIVGLDYVLAGVPEMAADVSLQAVSDLEFVILEADAVREALSVNHQACVILLREMARRVLGTSMGQPERRDNPSARICAALFDLVSRASESDAWRIETMPRHRELGSLSGASEKEAAEAVARLIGMRILKRDYPGMLVMDYPALMEMAS